jgi:tRNA pseudouridine13 synthase
MQYKDNCNVRVYQPLNLSAKLKANPEDFIVEEQITVEFSGEGEHVWVYLQKQGCNTEWVAGRLARYCNVKQSAVSYAGLKDRHALTSQWFSIHLPGIPTPDLNGFESFFNESVQQNSAVHESIKILRFTRHYKKLQRGALKSNRFKIRLHELSNTNDDVFTQLQRRCHDIALNGVPNYFGEQRFGRERNNLAQAEKYFHNPRRRLSRHKRSLYLSAARSWLFNCILSERVRNNVWNSRMPGDVFMLQGRTACFRDEVDSTNVDDSKIRLTRNEIHPTCALWGEGDRMVTAEAAALESMVIDCYPVFRDGLTAARVQAMRRASRVVPENMDCYREADDFVVLFELPAGSFATEVLNEIFTELL